MKLTEADIPDGIIKPRHQQIGTDPGVLLAQASTSVVGSWVPLQGPFDIILPTARGLLDLLFNMAIGHSAADALFGLWGLLYQNADRTGVAQTYLYGDSLKLPTTSAWAPALSWLGSGLWHFGTAMPMGHRYLYLWGKNYTVGALYFGQNSGAEFFRYIVSGM